MNETLEAEYLYHLVQDKELFRLASLVGCEPKDELRHRLELAKHIAKLLAEVGA
jgi:hypothetical protein